MFVKRGILFLIVLLSLLSFAFAQEQCLIVNKDNIDEAAMRIWNTFSNIPKFNDNPELILEASVSAVDSLKEGDNGYEFKEKLKDYIKSIKISMH